MFKEIWDTIRDQFVFIYENILKFLINPIYITLSLLSLYFFYKLSYSIRNNISFYKLIYINNIFQVI